MADPAAVFARGHVQAQMQAIFNAPIAAIGGEHLPGREGCRRAGADQPLGFDLIGLAIFLLLALDEASQACRLGYTRKASRFGAGRKANQTAGFGPSSVDFEVLNQILRMGFKKKCPTDARRGLARWRLLQAGCL